ncbi:MAG: TldD/PmbA family protein, partial [Dehalococcoidia bacterium]|nr:TldD/PmbA family protein [Dehalococcoidia bacterium]
TGALKGHGADYAEVRLETGEVSHVTYRGRFVDEVTRAASSGGNVRVRVGGGWGFVSFNELDGLKDKIALAVRQAKLVNQQEGHFAPVEPVVDIVPLQVRKDPRALPFVNKKKLLEEYNEIILGTPGIQTSSIAYADSFKKVVFANSEGSYIEQSRVDVTLRLSAVARDGGEVQQTGLSIGSNGDFAVVEGLHDRVSELAKRAVKMLAAPKVKNGEYTVILDPVLAGVFVHEAFGHLSELDHIYENEKLRQMMVLGRKFGGNLLNIVDGAAIPGLRGSFKYDDEGVPAQKTYLIREGYLVGRLHSRETAGVMGEKPTGNARAVSYLFPPIVRMTNTYIEPGEVSFDDMIKDIRLGIYAKDWYGGTTSLEMFTFSAGEAYMIRDGKVAEMMRPVTLSGNVFTTLANIDAVGNDLEMNQGGGCGKADQAPLPVSNGSPHIRIRRCLVGGR